MKKEDKELLMKDLSARLPYKVKVSLNHTEVIKPVEELTPNDLHIREIGKFKPYLRPMSSMTEEELEELLDKEDIDFDGKGELVRRAMIAYRDGKRLESNSLFAQHYAAAIDWLNAHHFDYRGLIDKGLAVEIL